MLARRYHIAIHWSKYLGTWNSGEKSSRSFGHGTFVVLGYTCEGNLGRTWAQEKGKKKHHLKDHFSLNDETFSENLCAVFHPDESYYWKVPNSPWKYRVGWREKNGTQQTRLQPYDRVYGSRFALSQPPRPQSLTILYYIFFKQTIEAGSSNNNSTIEHGTNGMINGEEITNYINFIFMFSAMFFSSLPLSRWLVRLLPTRVAADSTHRLPLYLESELRVAFSFQFSISR